MPVANKFANNSTFLVEVKNVKSVDDKTVENYSKALTFKDSVAPEVTGVTYPNNHTAKVTFSEEMSALAGSSVKVYDGSTEVTAAGLNSAAGIVAAGDNSLLIDLTNAEANKEYTVKVFGAMDLYNNFAGTQTFKVVKTNADTVKPTVESVVATALNTFKISFSEKVIVDPVTGTNGYGDFAVGAVTGKLAATDAAVTSVTPSADGKTLTVVLAANATAGLNTVKVNNYFDISSNKQTTEYVKVVNFAADTTAPKVVSTKVEGNTLYVTYDEEVSVAGTPAQAISAGATYVKDSIEKTVAAAFGGAATLHDPDGDTKSDTIKIDLTGQSAGEYTATLVAAVATDGTNPTTAKQITFTYNPAASSDKPKVVDSDNDASNGITGVGFTAQSTAAPNQITLTFDKPVTSATALNVNNYLIDGVVAFEKAIFVGNDNTVRLTLKQGAVEVTASRALTISNVASTGGTVMDKITFVQPFTENVAPELKSAKLIADDKIEVKFSELLTATTLTGGTVKDFAVYLGGTKLEDVAVANVAAGATNDTFVITLSAALTATDLEKALEVKFLETTDAKDASAITNAAKGNVTVTVAK